MNSNQDPNFQLFSNGYEFIPKQVKKEKLEPVLLSKWNRYVLAKNSSVTASETVTVTTAETVLETPFVTDVDIDVDLDIDPVTAPVAALSVPEPVEASVSAPVPALNMAPVTDLPAASLEINEFDQIQCDEMYNKILHSGIC